MANSKIDAPLYAISRIQLGTAQTVNGNFDVAYPSSKSGYTTVGIVLFNLGDRGLGGKVFITGYDISSNIVHVYGRAETAYTLSGSSYIDVLYMRS